jgi:hypothetical protein
VWQFSSTIHIPTLIMDSPYSISITTDYWRVVVVDVVVDSAVDDDSVAVGDDDDNDNTRKQPRSPHESHEQCWRLQLVLLQLVVIVAMFGIIGKSERTFLARFTLLLCIVLLTNSLKQ